MTEVEDFEVNVDFIVQELEVWRVLVPKIHCDTDLEDSAGRFKSVTEHNCEAALYILLSLSVDFLLLFTSH